VWLDPEWGGVLDGKSHEWEGGMLLPAQPFMPARLPIVPCASVQWLTLSGTGAGLERCHMVPVGCPDPTGPP